MSSKRQELVDYATEAKRLADWMKTKVPPEFEQSFPNPLAALDASTPELLQEFQTQVNISKRVLRAHSFDDGFALAMLLAAYVTGGIES